MFANSRAVSLVCAFVLLFQTAAPAFAQNGNRGEQPPAPIVLREDEAYQEDAEAYVAAFGGTVLEAIRRLKLQGAVAELDATLQSQEKATFAGLWIEHTPRFRVVVQLTQGGKEIVLPYIQKGPIADLVEVQAALVSLAQLRAIQADVIQDIQSTGVPAESDIDLQANGIKVYVTSRKQFEVALAKESRQLPDNVQVIEIAQLSQPMANWYAGNSLNACTAGFSLWNVAYVRYSSTAGHCTGSAYSPLGAPIFSRVEGAYDFQVNPAPSGYTIKNWAADNIVDSTPYYREITSWWASASVGTALCKFGKTTGFTCGTVESSNYNYQGSSTWLLVKSTNANVKISCGGDSGSPVYSGSTAVGELVAGWCDLGNNKFIAMPVGKYRDHGYYIMTVP